MTFIASINILKHTIHFLQNEKLVSVIFGLKAYFTIGSDKAQKCPKLSKGMQKLCNTFSDTKMAQF